MLRSLAPQEPRPLGPTAVWGPLHQDIHQGTLFDRSEESERLHLPHRLPHCNSPVITAILEPISSEHPGGPVLTG